METYPDGAAGLIDRHLKFLRESFSGWGSNQAAALARQRAAGDLSALVWTRGNERPDGLVWVHRAEGGARVHGVWLEPGGAGPLGRMLADAGRSFDGPVASVTDIVPGLDHEQQVRFFANRGYWHRAKVLMRRTHGVRAGRRPEPTQIRPIRPTDLTSIVGIYVRAYAERPGEFWTWGAPDGWSEAEQDVRSHRSADGSWAPEFLPDASLVWEEDGSIRGAILVGERRGRTPYIEDLIVEPSFHRRGIGRALLSGAIDRLERTGAPAVELAAIQFGAPYRLYQTLGFDEVAAPEGQLDGHWVLGARPF